MKHQSLKTKIKCLYTVLCISITMLIYMLYAVVTISMRPKGRFLTGEDAKRFRRIVPDAIPLHADTAQWLNSGKQWVSNHTRNEKFPHSIDSLSADELTVVTAYFNIGQFQKGAGGTFFTPSLYRHWMKVFSRIENPLVAYFDREEDAAYMRHLRSSLPDNQTRIIVVDRTKLWAFTEVEPRINKIFSRPDYPYNPPNTVVSEYSAAMHAKYEVMLQTIHDNPFNTAYVCWLDIGLFRDYAHRIVDPSFKPFRLWLPQNFDENRIAYTEVYEHVGSSSFKLSAQMIIEGNYVWVCGCFFIGRVDVMWRWAQEYMHGVERMLDQSWMSTDQQLIYWLFHGQGYDKRYVTTHLQTYHADREHHEWFNLGFLSQEAGERRHNAKDKHEVLTSLSTDTHQMLKKQADDTDTFSLGERWPKFTDDSEWTIKQASLNIDNIPVVDSS